MWEQTTPPEQVPEVVLKADEQYKKDDKYNVIKTQIEESVTPEQLDLNLVTPEQEVAELGNTIEQLEDIVLEKMANNDDYTADLEELERKRKEQKKRQVVIKSIEEVAEDRVEANKPDEDEDPIIRNMAEEDDKTPADIEKELNESFAEAGVEPIEAKQLSELGIRPEDLAMSMLLDKLLWLLVEKLMLLKV